MNKVSNEFCTMGNAFGDVSAEELSQIEGGARLLEVVRNAAGAYLAEKTGSAVYIGNNIYLPPIVIPTTT